MEKLPGKRKVSPQESDHIWDCNWIRQATASETTEIYCALKSCKTWTCGGSAQPLLHALSLAPKMCIVLSLLWGWSSFKEETPWVARPGGCCAGNGIFFSMCNFKAQARPGQPDQTIYWQVKVSTASTAEQRILRVLNISYPLDQLGFAWIVPKGSTQTTLC